MKHEIIIQILKKFWSFQLRVNKKGESLIVILFISGLLSLFND